jgi:hypothetical protein
VTGVVEPVRKLLHPYDPRFCRPAAVARLAALRDAGGGKKTLTALIAVKGRCVQWRLHLGATTGALLEHLRMNEGEVGEGEVEKGAARERAPQRLFPSCLWYRPGLCQCRFRIGYKGLYGALIAQFSPLVPA